MRFLIRLNQIPTLTKSSKDTKMKRSRVMTVVGTRPELIRLSSVIRELDKYCEHTLVHTGQNYDFELNQIFYEELGIRTPDVYLDCAKDSKSAFDSIGKLISGVAAEIDKHEPDAFLVLGDTNSCLSAIAAKRKMIPIFHMEAGNRCFDARVPEETNRKIVDHLADINLPYSDIAREYLLAEGIRPESIIKTGSPMFEVLSNARAGIEQSAVLENLDLEKNEYFLISAHREENIEPKDMFLKLTAVLEALAQRFDLPVVVSTHPRLESKLKQFNLKLDPRIKFIKPLGYFDYVKLQQNARIVLSDSGTISEESSILGFAALNIREAHERPEAMEQATTPMVGLEVDRVLEVIDVVLGQRTEGLDFDTPTDYLVPNVAAKVARIIFSHIDYVNSRVWHKHHG